jgi:hypothetical protein
MSASEWAAIAVAAVAALAVVALAITMASLLRTIGALQQTVDTLRAETIPLVTDVQDTARQASNDLERAGAVLHTAESLSSTVDSASRLAYRAFSNPVVKVMAFGSGTSRAYRRLRQDG